MPRMDVVSTVAEVRAALHDKDVALVPTMGFLHEGHASLIRMAAETGMTVAVSIFVNPTQFNDPADLQSYPRDLERDKALALEAGCDVLFVPALEEMYPLGDSTRFSVGGIANVYEGEHRPGHFEGVATVVAKLFLIVQPNVAIFGEKDWQQCLVVSRMVKDLHMPIDLRFGPTLREPDGLAMSSRNARLTDTDRAIASQLYQQLVTAAEGIRAAKADPADKAIKQLEQAGFRVEYLAVVDRDSLLPTKSAENARVIAAAWLGDVRLIDNLAV